MEQRAVEPVGGAARFAGAVRRYREEQPLVLFSGDCLVSERESPTLCDERLL